MKYIVANWKANKTQMEIEDWFKKFNTKYKESNSNNLTNLRIIICPSFISLSLANKLIKNYSLPLLLGAQDVSSVSMGSYTGEVTAQMLKNIADYVIVGHSERRSRFKESDETLTNKVNKAMNEGIKPIYCIQDEKTLIPEGVSLIAYEPIFAIGSGRPDTVENTCNVITYVKQNASKREVLYGGSVTKENVKSYLSSQIIDGALIGKASLDPDNFWEIINAAIN